ncbi:Hypothetical protein EPM1_2873 [Stenotrophomonas maltophilia EPM1]|nr:Hypothetical protein EPM1_2873 [Stenotrophomonas maltophilia EPM1]
MEGRIHGGCSAGGARGRGGGAGVAILAPFGGRDVSTGRPAPKSALKLAGFLQITQ